MLVCTSTRTSNSIRSPWYEHEQNGEMARQERRQNPCLFPLKKIGTKRKPKRMKWRTGFLDPPGLAAFRNVVHHITSDVSPDPSLDAPDLRESALDLRVVMFSPVESGAQPPLFV